MGFNVAQASVARQSAFPTAGGVKFGMLALGAIAATSLAPAAFAHQTQISDGVGGTHHIEPNDTPRAGEPSQTWFALTQAGGTAIGLSDCDCELVLTTAGGEAIANPTLTAIAVEGLTDVPAAELTFPQVGAYVLTMTGRPRKTADFPDFRLDFPVTVAAGKAIAEQAVPEAAEAVSETAASGAASPGAAVSQTVDPENTGAAGFPVFPTGVAVVLATASILLWRRKQH